MAEILSKGIKNIYFLGIGGIGMSALARYFRACGYKVAGYDRTPSPLTAKMQEEEGIAINYRDEEEEIALEYRDTETTLVVYTPAIPANNRQLLFLKGLGFTLHKRAEVLGMISRQGKAICVAGTHGKTTVSTMVAFLLYHSSVGCNAFLGGISMNFGTNLLLNRKSPYIVIEADEFDRSFLHLSPKMVAITAMDEDHLD
ncbi:MAG: Mur ligase domain-containing protein, partial [Odoribacter sp.]